MVGQAHLPCPFPGIAIVSLAIAYTLTLRKPRLEIGLLTAFHL